MFSDGIGNHKGSSVKNGTVYILSAVRTPIGKFGGGLADLTAPDLGVIAVRAALERAFDSELPPERQPGMVGKSKTASRKNENVVAKIISQRSAS